MMDESRIRLLRRERVKQLTGLSTTGLYARMRMQEFPRPVSLGGGGRAVAWIESEVLDWIRNRKAERDAEVLAS